MERHPRKGYGILSPRDNVHFYYEDELLRCYLGYRQESSQLKWILSENRPWILLQYDENYYIEYIEVYYRDKETLVTDNLFDNRAIIYLPKKDGLF